MASEYTESMNQILKDTLPELPGAIRSVAARELRLAMREFFERSYAWTAWVEEVAIPTGQTAIQIDDSDDNTEVIAILDVRHGSPSGGYVPLTPLPSRPLKAEGGESPMGWYVTSNPDEFRLHPYVDTATTDTLEVEVALIPAFDIDLTQDTLPRQITLKFYDAIRDGFLARMYTQPAKPYTNPVEAQRRTVSFNAACGYYAAQRKKGFNNAPNWSFPRGWTPRMRGGVRSG